MQAVAAILLILGSFLVLRAFALADANLRPGPTEEPRLRLVASRPPKGRGPRPEAEHDWRRAA